MANVYKRNKVWYIRYHDLNGKDRRKAVSWARSKRDAKNVLAKAISDSKMAKERAYWGAVDTDMTVSDLLDDFLDYGRTRKRSWRVDVSRANQIKVKIGHLKAAEVIPTQIEDYLIHIKSRPKHRGGGKISGATVNRHLALIKTAYNHAIRNRRLKENPAKFVKPNKENNARDLDLTIDEYHRLMDAAAEHIRPIIRLAWETGMRRAEIENMLWSQVDLKEGIISLEEGDTKTGEARTIPLTQNMTRFLRKLRRDQTGQPTDIQTAKAGYVFRYKPRGGLYRHVGSTRRSFNTAVRKANLENFHFHDLRHCFRTRARRAAVPRSVSMAIMGHKTNAIHDRYDTISISDKRDALKRISEDKAGTKAGTANQQAGPEGG